MIRWGPGAAQVSAMLAVGELEPVAPSPQNAARQLAEADRHLRSAPDVEGHPVDEGDVAVRLREADGEVAHGE